MRKGATNEEAETLYTVMSPVIRAFFEVLGIDGVTVSS